jgi:hypothetical protein
MNGGAFGECMLAHRTKRPRGEGPPNCAEKTGQPKPTRQSTAQCVLSPSGLIGKLWIKGLAWADTRGIALGSNPAGRPKAACRYHAAQMLSRIICLVSEAIESRGVEMLEHLCAFTCNNYNTDNHTADVGETTLTTARKMYIRLRMASSMTGFRSTILACTQRQTVNRR